MEKALRHVAQEVKPLLTYSSYGIKIIRAGGRPPRSEAPLRSATGKGSATEKRKARDPGPGWEAMGSASKRCLESGKHY
jgi:hypothetical protein